PDRGYAIARSRQRPDGSRWRFVMPAAPRRRHLRGPTRRASQPRGPVFVATAPPSRPALRIWLPATAANRESQRQARRKIRLSARLSWRAGGPCNPTADAAASAIGKDDAQLGEFRLRPDPLSGESAAWMRSVQETGPFAHDTIG